MNKIHEQDEDYAKSIVVGHLKLDDNLFECNISTPKLVGRTLSFHSLLLFTHLLVDSVDSLP